MIDIILNQINGIYKLYIDGLITAHEAKEGMEKTIIYYFGNVAEYSEYITKLFH